MAKARSRGEGKAAAERGREASCEGSEGKEAIVDVIAVDVVGPIDRRERGGDEGYSPPCSCSCSSWIRLSNDERRRGSKASTPTGLKNATHTLFLVGISSAIDPVLVVVVSRIACMIVSCAWVTYEDEIRAE